MDSSALALFRMIAYFGSRTTGSQLHDLEEIQKKSDWANHLVESLVVFIGNTAAFILDNWQEEFKDG